MTTIYPENDDDARDLRALLEATQAQLSLIADEPLTTTDRLLVASINIQTALTISIGRMTGVLNRQTTDTGTRFGQMIPSEYESWARANKMTIDDAKAALQYMERQVPDWPLKKIQAIKEVRAVTTLGLKESKDLVDMATSNPNYWWRAP